MDFDLADQIFVSYFAFLKDLRKYGNKMGQCLLYLYTSRKLMVQLGGRFCIILSLSCYPNSIS